MLTQGSARRLHMGCGESLRALLPAANRTPQQTKEQDQGRQLTRGELPCLGPKGERR